MLENRCLSCMKECPPDASICPLCGKAIPCPQNSSECLQLGHKLGRYIIGRQVKRDMDSITYIAFDTVLHTSRWIKEYFPYKAERLPNMEVKENPEEAFYDTLSMNGFLHEAEVLDTFTQLSIPNVPHIYDCLNMNNTKYLVIDNLEGHDLNSIIYEQNKGFHWEKAVKIILQVLHILSVIHKHEFILEEIIPSNIILREDGYIFVTGFRFAHRLEKTLQYLETIGNNRLYSAPELDTHGNIGIWTDIYSVGVCLFKLIAGRFPKNFMPGRLPCLHDMDLDVPERLDEIIRKATEYMPQDRFQTADEMCVELEMFLKMLQTGTSNDPRMEEKKHFFPLFSLIPFVPNLIGAIPSFFTAIPAFIAERILSMKRPIQDAKSISKISQVGFSAFSNESVKKKNHYCLRIFMYEESEKDVIDNIKKASKELSNVTESAVSVPVSHGQDVTIRLSSSIAIIDDNELTLPWEGYIREFSFYYFVPENIDVENIVITANIYINHVIASRLQIKIKIDEEETPLSINRTDMHEAFMSYASVDRKTVLKIAQGMHKARPDLVLFLDVESLRSGEKWASTIDNRIDECDVLYLCWSRSAKQSEWVDYEWRYAYRSKGEEFIEPIPLEPPSLCRPPEELKDKHFNDVEMLLGFSETYVEKIQENDNEE